MLGKSAPRGDLGPILERPGVTEALPIEPASSPGKYTDLIRQLFHRRAAVAIIGSDLGYGERDASPIVEDLASELSITGKRVLVVVVRRLLRMNPIIVPGEPDLMPGDTPHVWIWPASIGHKIEFSKSRDACHPGNWLDSLRRAFDAVLLDCPCVEAMPGVTEVASMADAALLVVEAGHTLRKQLLENQQALQLRGALIAGCILMRRS
jgi:hypothetical protein